MVDLNNLDVRVFTGSENIPNSDKPLYWLTVYKDDEPAGTLECLSEEEVMNTSIKDILELVNMEF